MVSVAIFCMSKHAIEAASCRFYVYRNGVLIWIITNLIMKN